MCHKRTAAQRAAAAAGATSVYVNAAPPRPARCGCRADAATACSTRVPQHRAGDPPQDTALEFQHRIHEVTLIIFRAFALALGRPETFFDEVRPLIVLSHPALTATHCRRYGLAAVAITPRGAHSSPRESATTSSAAAAGRAAPPTERVLVALPARPSAQAFEEKSLENPSFLAWNYYPPLSEEQASAVKAGKTLPPRLHAHADMDVLTILFQGEGCVGLEIAPGKDIENPNMIEVRL